MFLIARIPTGAGWPGKVRMLGGGGGGRGGVSFSSLPLLYYHRALSSKGTHTSYLCMVPKLYSKSLKKHSGNKVARVAKRDLINHLKTLVE